MSTAIGFKKHLPNILSWFRIIGSFSLPLIAWKSWEKDLALPFIAKTFSNVPIVWIVVYVILVSTDKLDGTAARKLRAESEFGAAIDAIADVVVLVMGATICFVWFVRDNLETMQFWICVIIMIICVVNKIIGFFLVQIFHGTGNMGHTIYHKTFALWCYVAVFFWAFLRTIPVWSILIVLGLNLIATIDEYIYIARSTEYNPDFKGHGLEKYEKRRK